MDILSQVGSTARDAELSAGGSRTGGWMRGQTCESESALRAGRG